MVQDAISDREPHEVHVPDPTHQYAGGTTDAHPPNGKIAAANKARRLVAAAKAEGWVLKTAVVDDGGTGWKVLFKVTGKVEEKR